MLVTQKASGWKTKGYETSDSFFHAGVDNNRSEGVASMLKSSLIFLAQNI